MEFNAYYNLKEDVGKITIRVKLNPSSSQVWFKSMSLKTSDRNKRSFDYADSRKTTV